MTSAPHVARAGFDTAQCMYKAAKHSYTFPELLPSYVKDRVILCGVKNYRLKVRCELY